MTESFHESSHSSSMQRVRNTSSLQRQQVVAEGLPVAQGGPLPLPLGGPQPGICLFGCLVTAAVDQVEVAHTHPGLHMAPTQSLAFDVSAFEIWTAFEHLKAWTSWSEHFDLSGRLKQTVFVGKDERIDRFPGHIMAPHHGLHKECLVYIASCFKFLAVENQARAV